MKYTPFTKSLNRLLCEVRLVTEPIFCTILSMIFQSSAGRHTHNIELWINYLHATTYVGTYVCLSYCIVTYKTWIELLRTVLDLNTTSTLMNLWNIGKLNKLLDKTHILMANSGYLYLQLSPQILHILLFEIDVTGAIVIKDDT